VSLRDLAGALPPFLKVLIGRTAPRELGMSLLRLCAALVPAALAAVLGSAFRLPGTPFLSIALLLAAAAAFRGLDMLGRVLVARGVVLENLSRPFRARRWYGAARHFLFRREDALLPMARLCAAGDRLRLVHALARVTRRTRDAAAAAFVIHELCQAGEYAAALRYCRGLPPSADPAVALSEARILLALGEPRESLERLAAFDGGMGEGEVSLLRARALSGLDRHEEAMREIDAAVKARSCNASFQLARATVLVRAGRDREALLAVDRSLYLHEKDPEALTLKAALCERLGRMTAARESLRRALFYDNMNTAAFLRLREGSGGREAQRLPAEPDGDVSITADRERFAAAVGDTVSVTVRVQSRKGLQDFFLTVLEPYGGGLEASKRTQYAWRIEPGQPFSAAFRISCKRASAVNLGEPWRLNIVGTHGSGWASCAVEVDVRDTVDGEVFFVITDDHETALRGLLRAEDARTDLIEKTARVHDISEPLGIRWTHLLDAGTALGLERWAAERSAPWAALHADLHAAYAQARERRHDLQLHLHLSAFPDSYFFCYRFDAKTQALSFDWDKRDSYFPGRQPDSWASVASALGPGSSPDSRAGSLQAARRELQEMVARPSARFSAELSGYVPVLFRSGQWDFGRTPAEREVSFLALREAGLLADSSASSGGSFASRTFSFGSPPAAACYFTRRADVTAPARSLQDIGLTEVLPIVMPQGRHAVTPRDDPAPVLHAYRTFLHQGKVKPGRHIIMEIEHIATLPDPASGAAQWRAIERHLRVVSRSCPLLRSRGAAEALESWWDYYSPDLIGLPRQPVAAADGNGHQKVVFPLRFLAASSLTRAMRKVPVVIPLPFPGEKREWRRGRIMRGGRCIWQGTLGGRIRITTELPLSRATKDDCRLEVELAPSGQKQAATTKEGALQR
jgi:tetratricopeptide (TPR) repeat protein